jgi:hypothetical protein
MELAVIVKASVINIKSAKHFCLTNQQKWRNNFIHMPRLVLHNVHELHFDFHLYLFFFAIPYVHVFQR